VREERADESERKSEGVELTPEIVFDIGFEAPGRSARGAFYFQLPVFERED